MASMGYVSRWVIMSVRLLMIVACLRNGLCTLGLVGRGGSFSKTLFLHVSDADDAFFFGWHAWLVNYDLNV